MINRLFRSASRVSGIAVAAMVVAAMPIRHYDTSVGAQGDLSQNPAATRIISHAAPAAGDTSAPVAKVDVGFVPSTFHHYPPP